MLTSRIGFLLQMNGKVQAFSNVGNTGEPRENSGGTWIYITPGLRFQIAEAFATYGVFQLPAYQNVHGIQQTSNLNLQFGITAEIGSLN